MDSFKVENKTPKIILLLILLLISFFFLTNRFVAYGEDSNEWSRTKRLATDSTTWQPETGKPDIVIDPSNNIHIVWLSQSEETSSKQLYYRIFDEKGILISEQELSNHSKISKPEINIDQDGKIIVMWIEENHSLYYVNITHTTNKPTTILIPLNTSKPDQFALQIDESNIFHIILRSGSPGAYQISYIKYDPTTKTKKNEELLTDITSCSSPVFLLDSNDKANIVYWENIQGNWILQYTYFDHQKLSIVQQKEIGNTVTLRSQNVATMTIDSSDNLHIFWTRQIEGLRVRSSSISYVLLDQNRNSIITESVTEDKTGWPSASIDSEDTVHIVWTDWRGSRMEIYDGVIEEKERGLLVKEKTSNSPSGTWLPIVLIDEDDFKHVFWLEFFKNGVRISYKNTRWPEKPTVITRFIDSYGFISVSEVIQGLSLSIVVSLLIAPIVMFSPSISLGILALLIVKRVLESKIIKSSYESIQIKWLLFPFTLGLIKLLVVFFKVKFYYNFSYQVTSLILIFGLTLLIQKRRGKSIKKLEDWNSTFIILGLLDGFFTALPYVLAYVTGFG